MPNDNELGSRLLAPLDSMIDRLAPVHAWQLSDGTAALGFRVGTQHSNPQGNCHGGAWATMADVLMGLNIGLVTGLAGPTVSMALDFVGPAAIGQWVEGTARVLRQTPRLGFADCLFTADGKPALRANAVFRRKSPTIGGFEAFLAPK